MKKEKLDTPVAIVDMDIMERNIKNMAEFTKKVGINLRPHVKTHKIPEIAKKQIKAGAIGITVAKISEAEIMEKSGIRDIYICTPIVGEEKVKKLMALSKKINKLYIAVDDIYQAEQLSRKAIKNNIKINVIILIELGFKRCGVLPGKPALKLAEKLSKLKNINLCGIAGYAGHVYNAKTVQEIERIGKEEGKVMVEQANELRKHGFNINIVSVGSTPTAKTVGKVDGITEIRPGAYIFNDAMEIKLGVATPDTCALTIITTVVSRPTKDRAIIDAGSKVFSSDIGLKNMRGYGIIKNKSKMKLEILHEEHGILKLYNSNVNIKIGDRLEIIPNHVCSVVNLFDKLIGIKNDKVEKIWQVSGRGKVQ